MEGRVFFIGFIEINNGSVINMGNVYYQFPFYPTINECIEEINKIKGILNKVCIMSICEVPIEDHKLMNIRESKLKPDNNGE